MRKIKFAIDGYYHVYNRGVDKRIIFLDDRDTERFIILLFLSNSTKSFTISEHNDDSWSLEQSLKEDRGETLVAVGVWTIMPNHFHVLLREKSDGGVSKFMHKLSVGYSSYFNKKYCRTGSLLEGTFKASYVNSDPYLKYLYSYIHLNAISIIDKGWKEKHLTDKSKAKKFIREYFFSSYVDYIGEDRLAGKILNKDCFPDYFESIFKFEKMHNFWIENN